MNIRTISRAMVIVVGGIVAITVGFFMLRGTMRLWDKPKESHEKNDDGKSKF